MPKQSKYFLEATDKNAWLAQFFSRRVRELVTHCIAEDRTNMAAMLDKAGERKAAKLLLNTLQDAEPQKATKKGRKAS